MSFVLVVYIFRFELTDSVHIIAVSRQPCQ